MRTLFLIAFCTVFTFGCTSNVIKTALQGAEKSDQIDKAIFDRQHSGLVIYLYRDTIAKLQAAGTLNAEQHKILNAAWNDRDLIEFWAIQREKVYTLRLITVYQALYANQSIIDLFLKSAMEKVQTAKAAVADIAGKAVGDAIIESVTTRPATGQ